MKDDVIYRKEAIDAFWSLDAEFRPSAIDAILNILNGLPSAKSERKKGKWILKKVRDDGCGNVTYNCVCSECGAQAYEFKQPYCHRCGAPMEVK